MSSGLKYNKTIKATNIFREAQWLLYGHEIPIILAVYDKSHLQVVYDKFVSYFLSYSIRPSRRYSQSSHVFTHQKQKEAVRSETYL